MGNKPNKRKEKKCDKDYTELINQLGWNRDQFSEFYNTFQSAHQILNKEQFVQLYTKLRPEMEKKSLEKISHFIFEVFDADKNGLISFNEFLVCS